MALKRTDKRPEHLAWAALAISFVLCVSGFLVSTYLNPSRLMPYAYAVLGMTTVYAIMGLLSAYHRRRELEEVEEHARVSEAYNRSDLFSDKDEGLMIAAGTRRAFERYFMKGFTLVTGVLVIVYVLVMWLVREPSAPVVVEGSEGPISSLALAAVSLFMFLAALLSGSYFNGVSRESKSCHALRPAGQWLLLSSAFYMMACIVDVVHHFNWGVWDAGASVLFLVVLMVLGLELVINVIMEFYRPRTQVGDFRPLTESRLLGLVMEPGGIARNVAYSLDYQFGFKVSETWFYRFLGRSVAPFVGCLLVLLYMLDTIVIVHANEKGILEHFGKPADGILEPGWHWKFPRPIDRVHLLPVKSIQVIHVGHSEDEEDKSPHAPTGGDPDDTHRDTTDGRVILWSVIHHDGETNYLVPSGQVVAEDDEAENETTPVSAFATDVPVMYRIGSDAASIKAYHYNYADPEAVLKALVNAELIQFLSQSSFHDLIGQNRATARADLEKQVIAAVDRLDPPLGIEISFVGMLGMHPPVDVAESFAAVISADQKWQQLVHEASAEATELEAAAHRIASKTVALARAYAYGKSIVPQSRAKRFDSMYKAYIAQPDIFVLRTKLEILEHVYKGKRKFFLAYDPSRDVVIIIDEEVKSRPPLLDDDIINKPKN